MQLAHVPQKATLPYKQGVGCSSHPPPTISTNENKGFAIWQVPGRTPKTPFKPLSSAHSADSVRTERVAA